MTAGQGTARWFVTQVERWSARLLLLAIACSPFIGLSFVRLDHPQHLWPFHPVMRRVGILLPLGIIYVIVWLALFVCACTALWFGWMIFRTTIVCLWLTAFRESRPTWISIFHYLHHSETKYDHRTNQYRRSAPRPW